MKGLQMDCSKLDAACAKMDAVTGKASLVEVNSFYQAQLKELNGNVTRAMLRTERKYEIHSVRTASGGKSIEGFKRFSDA